MGVTINLALGWGDVKTRGLLPYGAGIRLNCAVFVVANSVRELAFEPRRHDGSPMQS
jgi:hypothetical protein